MQVIAKPTIFLTNTFSWIPPALKWGGDIRVHRFGSMDEVKKRVENKRIESFFWPDANLIGMLTLCGALQTPTGVKTPHDARDMLEGAFFDWLTKELSKQLGHFVREMPNPKPLEVGKPFLLCDMIFPESLPPSSIEIVSDMPILPTLKTFWFEITPLAMESKPALGRGQA